MQHDFILIDGSGSMANKWTETINAANTYVNKLAEDKVDTGVTLIVFDKANGDLNYRVIRDRITPPTWHNVTATEIQPGGWTPLNDAIAKMLLAAKGGGYEKVAIIIATDGLENASKEFPHPQGTVRIKEMLNECRARGWQVIFLGVDYDNMAQAKAYDNFVGATVSASAGSLMEAMSMTASKRGLYGMTGQNMSYSDQEKASLLKKKDDKPHA